MLFQQATFTKLTLTCVLIAVLALTLAQWVLSLRLNFYNKQEKSGRSAFEAGLFFCSGVFAVREFRVGCVFFLEGRQGVQV